MPLISLIVFLSKECYLAETLAKLQEQTYPNLEFLLVGTEQSWASHPLLEQVLERDSRFSYQMSCPEALWASGLEHAKGDYVLFQRDADYLEAPTIEKLYLAMRLADADIAISQYCEQENGLFYFYDWGHWFLQTLSGEEALLKLASNQALDYKVFASLYGSLFKKSLFTGLDFPSCPQLNRDALLWKLYYASSSVAYLNKPFYVYRRDELEESLPTSLIYWDLIACQQEKLKTLSRDQSPIMEEAIQTYQQFLANTSARLREEGQLEAARQVNQMLIASESGLHPFMDLQAQDFTIISNNCWAGYVYQRLALPYTTPFIGLFILPEDYYKLCKDLAYYLKQDLVFEEEMTYFPAGQHYYPVAHLADVTLHFLHYKDQQEALEKWERRKERINWDNLYFKFDNKDGASQDLLEKMEQLPYQNKVIFVHKEYPNLQSQSIRPGHAEATEVNLEGDVTTYFDMIAWLNKGGNKVDRFF